MIVPTSTEGYRLTANANLLPVKNYEPNSFGGPVETGREPPWDLFGPRQRAAA